MFTYHKRGGIRFCRIGRLGFSFYLTRKSRPSRTPVMLPYDVMVDLNHGIADIVHNLRSAALCN